MTSATPVLSRIFGNSAGAMKGSWEANAVGKYNFLVSVSCGFHLDINRSIVEQDGEEDGDADLTALPGVPSPPLQGLDYLEAMKNAVWEKYIVPIDPDLKQVSRVISTHVAGHYTNGVRYGAEFLFYSENAQIIMEVHENNRNHLSFDIHTVDLDWQNRILGGLQDLVLVSTEQAKKLKRKKDSVFLLGHEDIVTLSYRETQFLPKNYAQTVSDQFPLLLEEIKAAKDSNAGRLVILEGDPGTGKTYYVRSLIHALRNEAKIVFCPTEVLTSTGRVRLLERLVSFRNGQDMKARDPLILFIEDGDLALLNRSNSNMEILSSILGMTSGIEGDSLNAVVLVTTNSPTIKHDKAVQRTGRLLRFIHFTKLPRAQAREVLVNLGVSPEEAAESLKAESDYALSDVYQWYRKHVKDTSAQERGPGGSIDQAQPRIGF